MQKEINPVIQVSGSRFAGGLRVPIHRYLNATYNLSTTNSKTVFGSDLASAGMQDGCRILDFKAVNRTGRRVAVEIPADSGLCYFGPNGSPSAVSKERWAPLSRFPSLKVNIPDAIANTLDTNNGTTKLFTVSGAPGATADSVTVTFHYIEYV
jgi:hypothetical protein